MSTAYITQCELQPHTRISVIKASSVLKGSDDQLCVCVLTYRQVLEGMQQQAEGQLSLIQQSLSLRDACQRTAENLWAAVHPLQVLRQTGQRRRHSCVWKQIALLQQIQHPQRLRSV